MPVGDAGQIPLQRITAAPEIQLAAVVSKKGQDLGRQHAGADEGNPAAVADTAPHGAAVRSRSQSNQVSRADRSCIGEQPLADVADGRVFRRQPRHEGLELRHHFGLANDGRPKPANHFEEVRVGGFALEERRARRHDRTGVEKRNFTQARPPHHPSGRCTRLAGSRLKDAEFHGAHSILRTPARELS